VEEIAVRRARGEKMPYLHLQPTGGDEESQLLAAQGIEFLIRSVRALGVYRKTIRGVHLTRSLSGEYVTQTINSPSMPAFEGTFWQRYRQAVDHVNKIDQHDPFEDPAIAGLFDVIEPAYVTYEFSYKSRDEWLDKIRRQRMAMTGVYFTG